MSRFWRATACVALFGMLHVTLPPLHQLAAQPFRSFEEQNKEDADRFVDRAGRLGDVDAWTNYVTTGIAQERIQWEEESYAALREELLRAEAEAADEAELETLSAQLQSEFDAAQIAWESDATEFILSERGRYKGEQAALDVEFGSEAEYESLIAEVEAQTASDLELDLERWNTIVDTGRQDIVDRFEQSLDDDLNAARIAFTGTATERAAFEAQLDERAAELRNEFDFRDHFYLLRANNDYVARVRSDDVSARLLADQGSADAMAADVMAQTNAELRASTNDMLAAAEEQVGDLSTSAVPDVDDIGSLAGSWEAQVENVISAGLQRWDQAEEELYRQRLVWQNEAERSRAEGEAVWRANHEKLEEAREEWLRETREQIAAGRAIWADKFTEFAAGRAQAEAELEQFIQEERARRTAGMDRLGEMVGGGGSALLEAKEAYFYYEGLLAELNPAGQDCDSGDYDTQLYCFYVEQRDLTRDSIARFQAILGDSEDVLAGQMHSGAGDSGFLNDRRAYAGTLAAGIEGLNAGDFENLLQAEMQRQSEDYVLYQRDVDAMIQSNAVFTNRTRELQESGGFDFAAAADLDVMRDLVGGLGLKFDEHRRELFGIIEQDRGGLDDAARLAAVKSEITAWFVESQDRNARLREVVLGYFDGGQNGYYLTENESDPYLMTAAEYEWERLRRERNYLAKRFQTAEAVKRYADLAEENEAGLELAQVTAERAEIAKMRRDVREVYYLFLKGDLAVDPLVATNPAVREAELTRLLADRGVNLTDLEAYKTRLAEETDIMADLVALASPSAGAINSAIDDIDGYLSSLNLSEEDLETHRMSATREKLLFLRQEIDGGQSATVINNRWQAIQTGAGFLHGELVALAGDYDFDGLDNELTTIRDSLANPTLVDRRDDMYLVREQIELNATALASARARLDEARAAYSRARQDFDILRAGNSEELIRENMLDTTKLLATVLNRMNQIEDLPGFDSSRTHDLVSTQRADYLRSVSERRSADAEIARSSLLLTHVRGLEDAKTRAAALESTLTAAGDLSLLSVENLANVFIDAEAALITRTASSVEEQSFDRTIQIFDALKNDRDVYATALADYDAAVAAAVATPAELETLRAAAALAGDSVRSLTGLLITNLRGEEAVRSATVQGLLDPSAARTPEEVAVEQQSAITELDERALELARDAADDLVAYLEAGRETAYADLLKGANDAADAVAGAPRTDGGALAMSAVAGRDFMRAAIVRDWLLSNSDWVAEANAAPTPADPRTVAEKWDLLLDGVRSLAADSEYFEAFAAAIPADSFDQWVVDFQADRQALLAELDTVLGAPDGASLASAYDAMSLADREALARYGLVTPTALRSDLTVVRRAIDQDIQSLATNFRNIFLRESTYDTSRELANLSRDLSAKSDSLSILSGERELLLGDVAALDAQIAVELDPVILANLTAQRDLVQARVDNLTPRVTTLTNEIAALETDYREAANRLREIQQPGSSSPLMSVAHNLIANEAEGVQLLGRLGEQPRVPEVALRDPSGQEVADRLKAIVGFYQTDATGAILRDNSDVPLVSAEFQARGISDPGAALESVLAGNQRGDDLERWANRLIDWIQDPANSAEAEPELHASVGLLANALQAYRDAVAFIENRDKDSVTIEADAEAAKENATAMMAKLRQLQTFEAKLREAAEQARLTDGGDPVAAVLAVLEAPENANIFHLFHGTDLSGQFDGRADLLLQERTDLLFRMGESLRENRRNQYLTVVSDSFASALESYMNAAAVAADPTTVAVPDRADFFAAHPELSSASTLTTINSIPVDQDFRANLMNWVAGAPAVSAIYRDAALAALAETPETGAVLKTAVLTRLTALENEVNATMDFYLSDMEFVALRDATVRVDDSVANALAGLMGLSPEEMERMESEVYERELNRALYIASVSDQFVAADYPAELAEFILIQGFSQATDRQAAFLAASTSDIAAERDAATLDLRGLTGDFARYALALNFENYRQATPAQSIEGVVDAARANGDVVYLGEYLAAYMADGNLDAALLPDSGSLLFDRAARHEYVRLHGDGAAAGGMHNLDESRYLGDFADYIQISMLADFADRSGFVLTGATEAERRANYRVNFEAALDDAAYTRDGNTLRNRLLSSQQIDRLFDLAFAKVDLSLDVAVFLPDLVDGVDPAVAVPTADQELPPELFAIAGYDSADPRAVLAGVNPGYQRALAVIESTNSLRPGDVTAPLGATAAELDAIIERAGYTGAAALAAADRDVVHAALQARIAGAYFVGAGVADASGALAVLRAERAAQALAGDADALSDTQLLLASGTIERLEARVEAAIATAAPELADRRNEVALALAESLYVDRGVAAGYSAAVSDLFTQAPGLQDALEALTGSGQMSADLAGVLIRDRALIEQYLTTIQESDAERDYVENLFADQSQMLSAAGLDVRSELSRNAQLNQLEAQRRSAALLATLEDGQAVQRQRARLWSDELIGVESLVSFAKTRGDDPDLNRFVSYRSYVGSEVSYQEADYQEYLAGGPDPVKSYDEFHSARVLNTTTLDLDPRTLLNQSQNDWMETLRSDQANMVDRTVDLDDDGDAANDPQIVIVRSVSNEEDRIAAGNKNQQLEYMYQENLANNYLEATTRLNAAFVSVFQSASVAGGRGDTASLEDFSDKVAAAGYDIAAAAGVNDLSALESILQDATDRAAQVSDSVLQQKRDSVNGVLAQFAQSEQEFADSARRKHIARVGEFQFVTDTYQPIADELEAAEAEFAAATQVGDGLQNQFEAANVAYVADLNELADRYQSLTVASDEYEQRQAVLEFAETPYLLASIDTNTASSDQQSQDGFSADAREEFELARRALEAAQANLDEAAFKVRTEARLDDLQTLIAAIDGGTSYAVLDDAERDELFELRQRQFDDAAALSAADLTRLNDLHLREVHETYGDVLEARGDHLRHSLRMVRVQKAREIIGAEIEKRRAIAEQRRQAFESELGSAFGNFTDEDEIKNRNVVYQRLVSLHQSNTTEFFEEFRGWFTLIGDDVPDDEHQYTKSGPQNNLRDGRNYVDREISDFERAAIVAWGEAGGRLTEFATFGTIYMPYLSKLGEKDIAWEELDVTKKIFIPMIVTGTGMMTAGSALMASFFGFIAGSLMFSAGASMVAAGSVQIATKQAIYDGKRSEADDLLTNAQNSAHIASVLKVLNKQNDFEEALGNLEYFTKAPDLETAKERIIQWGAQHWDSQAMGTDVAGTRLYDITEEDLIYLFDSAVGTDFFDSNGNSMNPTQEQIDDALDVNDQSEQVEFKDAFGRRYDPAGLRFDKPGDLVDGVYRGGGLDYVRIRVTRHNGNWRYGYAPIIADDAPESTVFDLSKVLDVTTQHGIDLRDIRRDRYLAAGEAAVAGDGDRSLVLKDRDDVFQDLFENAAARVDGGREFSGYRLVYEDYQRNQREVLERELAQSRELQLQEWDLREQELNDRYARWDRKMQTLLSAGTDQWGRVNDNYLQEWRIWERTHDDKVEQGVLTWEEKIRDHYTERTDWENDVRQTAAEKSAEAVLTQAVQDLNSQISAVEQSLGMDFEELNATSAVNAVIDEIRRSQPQQTEQLQRINDSVSEFSTRIDLSSATGANIGAAIAGVSSDFREEARIYQRQMKTLANVKAAEQYRRMLKLFEDQMQVQNQQIADNTASAALASGFVDGPGAFTKTAGISGAKRSVDKYTWFDTQTVITEQLSLNGFSRLGEAELISFLGSKSTYEIDLYFQTQQLATRAVFERIIGKNPAERGKSRDVEVIGLFGQWVGAGKVEADEEAGTEAVDGFGELGSEGQRPGGKKKGFFPQLRQAAEELAEKDQEYLSDLQGPPFLQAVTGVFNGLNPLMMVANTAQNIKVATINGKELEDVLWANILNLGKQIGVAVGAALLSMTGVGMGVAAGLVLTTVSNMIQADPTTGEIGFAATPQALMSSALAVVGARFGVGVAGGASASAFRQAVAPAISGFVTGFAQSGMQYDADGNIAGFSGEDALVGGIVGGAAGGAIHRFSSNGKSGWNNTVTRNSSYAQHFASGYQQFAIGHAVVVGGEWIKAEAGMQSNLNMFGGDLGVLASLAGGALGTRIQSSPRLNPSERTASDRAQDTNHRQQARDILNGLGRMRDRIRGTTFADVRTGFRNAPSNALNGVINGGSAAMSGMYNGGAAVLGGMYNGIGAIGNALPSTTTVKTALYNGGAAMLGGMYNGGAAVLGGMYNGGAAMLGGMYNGGAAMLGGLQTAGQAIYNAGPGWKAVGNAIQNFPQNAANSVMNLPGNVMNGIQGIPGALSSAGTAFGNGLSAMKDGIKHYGGIALGAGYDAGAAVVKAGYNELKGIYDILPGLPSSESVGNALSKLYPSAIKDSAVNAWKNRPSAEDLLTGMLGTPGAWKDRFGFGDRDTYVSEGEDYAVDWSDELIRIGQGFGNQNAGDENYTPGIAGYFNQNFSYTEVDYIFNPETGEFEQVIR
ncbi:MAG: hypothetical protein NXI24_22820 [bacterium]|nr:hypothetical protein [bacterium]